MFLTKPSPKWLKLGLVLQLSLVLLVAFIFYALAVMATRTIWVDEARLLVNLYAININDVNQPLPFYDQASPLIPLAITKLLSLIAGTNFILFRALQFIVISLFMLPLLIWLGRKKTIVYLVWFVLIYAAILYTTVFFSSELKHYGFEMAAMFLFLYWFLIYSENQTAALSPQLIWLPAVCVYIGFSTLLIIPAFFGYVIVNELTKQPFQFASLSRLIKQHIKLAILMSVVGAITYLQMQQLTVFQIGNSYLQEVYANKGFVADIWQLAQNFIEIYRRPFAVVTFLMAVSALFLNRDSLPFKLSLLLIVTVVMVIALKLTGIYPVIYGRHVLWVLPISMLLVCFTMPALWEIAVKSHSVLRWQSAVLMVAAVLLLLAIIVNVTKLLKGDNAEITSNDSLYAVLNQQPTSDILVFAEAQPSLDIFNITNPMQHRFYGTSRDARISSFKQPIKDQTLLDWQYRQLPQHQSFLVIITHSDAIQTEPADSKIKALRTTLTENSCQYTSVYQGVKSQLLKVSCP